MNKAKIRDNKLVISEDDEEEESAFLHTNLATVEG